MVRGYALVYTFIAVHTPMYTPINTCICTYVYTLTRLLPPHAHPIYAPKLNRYVLDRDRQELYSELQGCGKAIRIPISQGIVGHVAMTGEVINVNDMKRCENTKGTSIRRVRNKSRTKSYTDMLYMT